MTLIELLVTLAILSVLSGITVLAVRRIDPPNPDDPATILAESLRVVVVRGHPAVVRLTIDGVPAFANVRPDGSIIADSAVRVDRLTGVSRVR